MSQDLNHVEDLFHKAMALEDTGAIDAFLEAACHGNDALKSEVRALVEACHVAGHFLSSPLQPLPGTDAPASQPSSLSATESGMTPASLARACLGRLEAGRSPGLQEALGRLSGRDRLEGTVRFASALVARQRLGRSYSATAARQGDSDDGRIPSIPGYAVGRRLGAGGLGTVYEAVQVQLQRTVAIKVLRGGAARPQRDQILEEARKAASIQDPGIITIYGVEDKGDCPAIIMERVEGMPIDQALQRSSYNDRARCLRDVCRVLGRAHARGLIHRDIKPENVLVDAALRPKLLDFGLALSSDEAGVRTGCFEGSPFFASPEQASGRALTSASDIFSFGSLMYKVLTGRVPFPGEQLGDVLEAICTTDPPFLRDVVMGIPDDLQAICLACLSWDPRQRPSAHDLEMELGRFLAGEPVRLRPALYGDILRRRLSEHAIELERWRDQGMVSDDEADRLRVVHRRILADEDHWIVDARRVTPAQTVLYSSTWLVVVASIFLVWQLRQELPSLWRWSLPMAATACLASVGWVASKRRDDLAGAAFLAAAVLSVAPATASCLAELGLLSGRPEGHEQLLEAPGFTNHQILVAMLSSLALSILALYRLRMTGFAWTCAVFMGGSYFGLLLTCGWLSWSAATQALYCLPLVIGECVALGFERLGYVRWAIPFHWSALAVLVGALDVMASEGPTLKMLGLDASVGSYFNPHRLQYLSFASNGLLFLALMLIAERARSLDLRRMGRVLELFSLPHLLTALYLNARNSGAETYLKLDVGLYMGVTLLLLVLGPWQSRWRLLMGGLAGLALGSDLLIRLEIVSPRPFIIGSGLVGLIVALCSYAHWMATPRPRGTGLDASDGPSNGPG